VPFLCGIDVGTTGARAVIIDTGGKILGTGAAEYPFETPQPGWSEQDPEAWWRGVSRCTREALAAADVGHGEIAAVGLSGQMHSLTLLDGAGRILRPAILWNDQRTAEECAEITSRIGAEQLIMVTCNPALPGFTAPKILWVRRHEPAIFARAASVLLPKDYVRFRLTGMKATEVSDASGTGLLAVPERTWSQEVLRALEIPAEWLPICAESPVLTAAVDAAGEAATGIPTGTPVAGGGGDQAAQAVGTGIAHAGPMSVTIGTSGVVFAALDRPVTDPEVRTHTFCHAVPGRWHVMGVMLSAGGALRWLRDAIAPGESYDRLTAEAVEVPAGAEGLVFLPYLSGERTPYPDPHARGVLTGLALHHGRRHLVQVRASGGGARSPLWRQILADVFDTEVVTMTVTEGAAYGAALLAGVGAGIFRTVDDACEQTIRVLTRVEPNPRNRAVYDWHYNTYRDLYPALRTTFDRLVVGAL